MPKYRPDEARNIAGELVRVYAIGKYTKENKVYTGYYLFYDGDKVYHIEKEDEQEIVYTFKSRCWQTAVKTAKSWISVHRPINNGVDDNYKVLFYESNAYLYYITSSKKIIKIREVTRCGKLYYKTENITDDDYKLLKQFNLDQVYEEKILNFRRSRGIVPERAKEIIWEVF